MMIPSWIHQFSFILLKTNASMSKDSFLLGHSALFIQTVNVIWSELIGAQDLSNIEIVSWSIEVNAMLQFTTWLKPLLTAVQRYSCFLSSYWSGECFNVTDYLEDKCGALDDIPVESMATVRLRKDDHQGVKSLDSLAVCKVHVTLKPTDSNFTLMVMIRNFHLSERSPQGVCLNHFLQVSSAFTKSLGSTAWTSSWTSHWTGLNSEQIFYFVRDKWEAFWEYTLMSDDGVYR